MTLTELLESVDAPAELITRCREDAWELDDAWERIRRGDHRVWLAACTGAPIELLVEGAAAALFSVLDTFLAPPPMLARAAELAVAGATVAELDGAAIACEALADEDRGSYRAPPEPGLAAACRAAALVVRAAEGLAMGEARREAVRLERARSVGARIGAGPAAVLPRADGPARLDVLAAASDPAQGAFLFATAAAAEAVLACVEAASAGGAEYEAARLDAIVREALEA